MEMTIFGIGVEKFGFQQSGVYFYFFADIFYRLCPDAKYPAEKSCNSAGEYCILQHRRTGNAENMGIYSVIFTNDYCELSAWPTDSGVKELFPSSADFGDCL